MKVNFHVKQEKQNMYIIYLALKKKKKQDL